MVWLKIPWLFLVYGRLVFGSPLGHGRRSCTTSGYLGVRKEWGEMQPADRIDYTSSVLCMQKLPPHLPTAQFPGVRNRFDDFVATHINYTRQVHYSGLFLPWHRHFIYLWEKAIREECGYSGYVPYWNWPLWADDLASSPLFDCSDTSLSGDGEYNPDEQSAKVPPGWVTVPRGTGGGCTRCGPFKDMEVNMGPFSHDVDTPGPPPPPQFEYNPRCLNRSLNSWVSTIYNNATIVEDLMATDNMNDFQLVLDHNPFVVGGSIGIHGGGHWSLGATHSDLYSSPQDPAFILHHSMIDRLWASWQNGDEFNRRFALNGTDGFLNPPEATIVTLDTILEFGVLDHPRRIREVMDPTRHHLCYIYT